jgi:hypothetical protein
VLFSFSTLRPKNQKNKARATLLRVSTKLFFYSKKKSVYGG